MASLTLSSSPTGRREGKIGEEGGRSTTTGQVRRHAQTRRRRAPLLREIRSVGAATLSFSGRRPSSAQAAPIPSERPRRRTQPRTGPAAMEGQVSWSVSFFSMDMEVPPWKAWSLMRFGSSPASLPDARRQLHHLQDGLLLLHGGVAAAPTLVPADAMEGFDWSRSPP
ncbi:hypothetical protein VPH35_066684 [Triticum aestivum]|uniref:uncharacterized protein n=1 Tax=Triticum aestivum TaxID=4565 RepID=UPI001D014A45|nr:uncharacterized protein LOC123086626 [Triticum aestivum]